MNFKLKNINLVIFSDIDGTFLDHETFDEGNNFDILDTLIRCNHHFIFNSSKTFYEIKKLQEKHNTTFPFICETGGGIYHKDMDLDSFNQKRGGYNIMFESRRVDTFYNSVMREIDDGFRQDLEIFNDINETRKRRLTGLSGENLSLASKRDFSILIKWKSDEKRFKLFKSALSTHGLTIVRGSRFCHICGHHNKGKALLHFLANLSSSRASTNFITVGIGDSDNDVDMLLNVDFPCVVRSPSNVGLAKKIGNRNLVQSKNHAPEGWEECVNGVFAKITSRSFSG